MLLQTKARSKTKLYVHKFIPSKLELDTNFQMNGTYVHRFDSMIQASSVLFNNTNNKSNDANMFGQFGYESDNVRVQKINYPENFFAPETGSFKKWK